MTSPYPPWLNQAIQSGLQQGDQSAAIAAAQAAANFQQTNIPTPLRRIFDPFYHCLGEVNDHIEIQLSDPRQALPAGRMTLKQTDPLAGVAINCNTAVVPFIYDKVPDWDTWPPPYRWSGRIDVAHGVYKDGLRTVQCELIGDKHWLDRILAWPDPALPVWVQIPGEWFGIGPGLTVIFCLIAEQSFRIQSGLWTFVNDFGSLDFAFQAWIQNLMNTSSLNLSDIMQVLHTPICVIPVNPLTDGSAWIEINGRMDSVWKLIQNQLTDNGFDMTVQMWLPGEPQPPGLAFPLKNPTVVVQLFDRSGIVGPFGPFEGLAVDITQIIKSSELPGSLVGSIINPLLGGNPQPYVETDLGVYLAPALGVNFTPPWVILNCDVEQSGIVEHSIDFHHPLAWQVVTGGQSPKWINDLINATLEFLIDSIMMIIGITGIPDTVLDGILNNTLFAFSTVDNFSYHYSSPYMMPEKFFPSGPGGLTLDRLFAEAEALWNVRGYPSGQISFIDGYPYTVGTDIQRGQLILYVYMGQLYIDYVEDITIVDNRTMFNKVTLQLGDGKSEESGETRAQRKLVGMETFINLILGGGGSQ
jgi:hypothetical protein